MLTAGALGAGCATTASAGYYDDRPDLVYVSPGVQVIADWNEPIFYADGFYWRNTGGMWYRSSYYSGGWAYARPPGPILSIRSPYTYRHYRPAGWAPRGRGPAPMARHAPPPPRMAPPPPRGGFAPSMRGAPPPQPMHAGPPGPGPGRPGPGPGAHPAPPSGPRARTPSMPRGPHR